MKIIKPSVELLWITPNAEQMIERAGRVCYRSEDRIDEGSAERFIETICKNQHESVLEHASASFRMTCDRGVMAELTRHRLASFSVESTRYCNYSKDKFGGELSFIRPAALGSASEASDWEEAMTCAENSYSLLIVKGIKPEIARSVLPMSLATSLVMTANFREWRHILRLRTAKSAHPQMRELMTMVEAELVAEAPSVFVR